MWSRGVILLLTLAAAALAFDRDAAKEKLTDFRIRSQNLHVDELEGELEKLEHSFDKLSAPLEKSEVDRLRARVLRIQPDPCGTYKVSCGGDNPECVHNLLVCDGVNDCSNGHDEDPFVCSLDVVRVGSTFTGVTHWSSCKEAHDHTTVITITASYRSKYFGPRAWVRATVTNELSEDPRDYKQSSYNAKGYFVFASRKLVLIPDGDAPDRFSTSCAFHFGDYDHADCRVLQEGSGNECAKLRVNRS